MITALWALDDFTADNGATRIVPGSHLRRAGKPEAAEAVPAEMPAGSVLLFSGRLYHGAGANTTGRPRLGVVIDYVQNGRHPRDWLMNEQQPVAGPDPGMPANVKESPHSPLPRPHRVGPVSRTVIPLLATPGQSENVASECYVELEFD